MTFFPPGSYSFSSVPKASPKVCTTIALMPISSLDPHSSDPLFMVF